MTDATDQRCPSLPKAIILQARPRTHYRALLVFLAPVLMGAGRDVFLACIPIAILWGVVAAAVYAFNDVADFDEDRRAIAELDHDERGRRPLHRVCSEGASERTVLDLAQVRRIGWIELCAAVALSVCVGILISPWVTLLTTVYLAANLWRIYAISGPEVQRPWFARLVRGSDPDILIVSGGFVLRVASASPLLSGARPPVALYGFVLAASIAVSVSKRLSKIPISERSQPSVDLAVPSRVAALVDRLRAAVTIALLLYAFTLHSLVEGTGASLAVFVSVACAAGAFAVFARRPRRNLADVLSRDQQTRSPDPTAERTDGAAGRSDPGRGGGFEWWEGVAVVMCCVAAALSLAVALWAT